HTRSDRDWSSDVCSSDLLTNAVDDDNTPPGIHGRWRATIAHEASHVVMHRVLFMVEGDQEQLLRTGPGRQDSQRLMRCLKKNVQIGRASCRERVYKSGGV